MHGTSINSLIRRVDDFQKVTEIETLERLDTENALLRDLISAYRRNWSHTMYFLEEAQAALMTLHKALSFCISEEIAAERAILGFWGIGREGESAPCFPGGYL